MQKQQNVFRTVFLFFLLSIMGLFVLNSLVLIHLTNNSLTDANRKLYRSKSERINQYLTDSFFTQLFRVVFDEIFSCKDSAIQQFILYDYPDTRLQNITQSINNLILGNEWLKDIMIYREGSSSVMGSELRRLTRSNPESSILLNGFKNYVLTDKESSGWIISNDGLECSKRTAIYFVKYPFTNPSRNRGFILFFIDTSAINRKIAQFIDVKNETIVLVDRKGNSLFQSGQKNFPFWIVGTDYSSADSGVSFWSDRNNQWQVTWQPLLTNDYFSLAMIIPSSRIRKQLLYSQRVILFFALLFILVIAGYLLFVIIRIQPPISRIMYMLDRIMCRSEPLGKKTTSLLEPDRIEKAGKDLIAHQFVTDLITVGFGISDFEEICQLLGVVTYRAPLYIIVAEQNHALFRERSWREKENIQISFRRLWQTYFMEDSCITINYPAGNLVCLVFSGQDTEKEFCVKFQKILENCQPNIVFSGPVTDRTKIPQLYRQLVRVLDRKFYQGYGNVFSPDDIRNGQREIFCQINPFRKLLMCEQYTEFMRLISDEIKKLGESHISPVIFKDFLIKIVELLVEVHSKKGGSSASFSYMGLRNELEDLSTTPEILSWIKEKTTQLAVSIRHTSTVSDEHKLLFEQIQKYMVCSLNRNISQITVAEHFTISSGFLSKLFREFYPEGFSQFLKECKMKEAEKRILEKHVRSVQELARSLGYSSTVYFSRQFRQSFGILPGEYMKNLAAKTLV